MLILITYDVETKDVDGKRRLRKAAKLCVNYGQRVQNSVFECNLDVAQLLKLKNDLLKVINLEKDSLRIYNLGKKWEKKIEHFGVKESYNSEGLLLV